MKKSELKQIIKEELQIALNEASLYDGIDKEIQKLIKMIKSGKGIDPRAIKDSTDGELLAMIILPALQGAALELKDAKSFRARIKRGM